VPVVYVIENNGVYGLTKGQFSATADVGSRAKSGDVNEFMPIDLCAIAIELGCGFVARSFSGDPKQLRPLLQAAFSHRGTAVLDVISPCVTFNNHEGSTKSYTTVKEHDAPLHEVTFVPYYENIEVDYEPGETREVSMHDGSKVLLKKLDRDFDPTDRDRSLQIIQEGRRTNRIMTGLLHLDETKAALDEDLGLVPEPLASLPLERVRPPREALEEIMRGLQTGATGASPAVAGGG
jgi:2-oxoglutarate ferredoxin oxidoreductase subunit beta